MARDDNIDLGDIRDQGRQARKLTDDENDPNVFTPQDCPYGPGELRDAWQAGFGAAKEEVRQVDTSHATTADVRREPAETVRKGAKGRGGKKGRGGAKGKAQSAAAQPSAVETGNTGTAETALKTTSGPANADQSSVPNLKTELGNPAGTEGDRTQLGGSADDAKNKDLM